MNLECLVSNLHLFGNNANLHSIHREGEKGKWMKHAFPFLLVGKIESWDSAVHTKTRWLKITFDSFFHFLAAYYM